MVGRALLAIAALALSIGTQTEAQSPADSLAVLRALATTLRSDARTVVPQFACYDRMGLCPAETVEAAHPMVRAFAEAAGAELVDARASSPPCPWGWERPPAPRGYRLRVARIQISGDIARVVVFRRCVNPPGGVHVGFAQDDEYELVRDPQGVWHVRGSRMLRITSSPSRLDRTTPGAERAVATGERDVNGSHHP